VPWFNAHSDMFTFRAALRSLRNFPLSEYRDAAHSAGGLLRRLPIRRANCVARSKLCRRDLSRKNCENEGPFPEPCILPAVEPKLLEARAVCPG